VARLSRSEEEGAAVAELKASGRWFVIALSAVIAVAVGVARSQPAEPGTGDQHRELLVVFD